MTGSDALLERGIAPDTRPTTGDDALRAAIVAFEAEWAAHRGADWSVERASAFAETLERLVFEAEGVGPTPVSEPLLELAVYLCAFADGGRSPSPAQRVRLDELVERTYLAAGGIARRRVPSPERTSPDARVVFYIRPARAEIPGLAQRLGAQRCIVRPFEDPARAAHALAQQLPDVLLVDVHALHEVHGLIARTERARGEADGRAVCVVVGAEIDLDQRLFAFRSGADSVCTGTDPATIATHVDEAIAQQRKLDFRVLIVEDDPQQALFCQALLQRRGVATRVAFELSGIEQAIAEFRPDLVLLDLHLPNESGIEVVQRIRERPECLLLPIVFLSGESDPDQRFDAIRLGGDDFISKPVKPKHLISTVESRVRRARLVANATRTGRGSERRGALVSREALVAAIEQAREPHDGAAAAVLVAADVDAALRDRIGFVGLGALAHQLGAALAAEGDVLQPVTSAGELAFAAVARGRDPAVLRQALEHLRSRLVRRTWGRSDDPLRLEFTLVAAAVGPETPAEHALRHLAAQLGAVQGEGGAACRLELGPQASAADPGRRTFHELLRGPLLAESVRLRFQPMVAINGRLANQYAVRHDFVPRRTGEALAAGIDPLSLPARELGLLARLDRHVLRLSLEAVASARERQRELRLFVPLHVATLLESAFVPWLGAELRSYGVDPTALALVFDANDFSRDAAPFGAALQSLQSLQLTGARICLGRCGDTVPRRLAENAAFDSISLVPGTTERWSTARLNAIAELVDNGKLVVAQDIAASAELPPLVRAGVHYVRGDGIAPWMHAPEHEAERR